MKKLIVGLGNIGAEYHETRHNIGFMILDALAGASNITFAAARYGSTATMRLKNQQLLLLKPSTFMNLSGEAVRYWVRQEKIDMADVLIICDDLALPLGTIRLRGKGSDGGHNGLKSIIELLGTQQFARMRFGIGGDFPPGAQIDYVLGHFLPQEREALPARVDAAVLAVKAWALSGLEFAMNHYNNK